MRPFTISDRLISAFAKLENLSTKKPNANEFSPSDLNEEDQYLLAKSLVKVIKEYLWNQLADTSEFLGSKDTSTILTKEIHFISYVFNKRILEKGISSDERNTLLAAKKYILDSLEEFHAITFLVSQIEKDMSGSWPKYSETSFKSIPEYQYSQIRQITSGIRKSAELFDNAQSYLDSLR